MAFKKASNSAGTWFRPKDHMNDAAILIDVTGSQLQVMTDNGPKDRVIAKLTYFATEAEALAGKPTEIEEKVYIEQSILAKILLEDVGVGDQSIATVAQVRSKKNPTANPYYAWRDADSKVEAAIIAYYEKAEAAALALVGEMPSFDDED